MQILRIFKSSILSLLFLLQFSFTQTRYVVSGKVTDGSHPISEAIVRLQATDNTTFTDENGNFELTIEDDVSIKSVFAWKRGYYNGNVVIEDTYIDLDIVLIPMPSKDNPSYKWIDPTPAPNDEINNCGDCHHTIYQQWLRSGHARSTTNKRFMDIYNGTDANGDHFYQPGYRLDYPHSKGNCSNCHAPTAATKNYIGVNINELGEVEKKGISCDFCHKVKNIHLKEDFSVNTGVMMMELLRPIKGQQIYFGPYDDSPMPYAFSPEISKSTFCAPCHQGNFWGLPIYESYSEWLNSPYAEKGIQCQDCHMPSDSVTTNIVEKGRIVKRNSTTIHSHLLKSPDDRAFLESAVKMLIDTEINNNILQLKVKIKNVGAGHHIPTGQPMRNMILIVKAVDSKGNELKYIGDNIIPFWGGYGDPSEGNYEGLPGKGYAKILFEHYSQYVQLKLGVKWQHIFPAPQWRVVRIKSDTRIPALVTDVSTYEFSVSESDMPITVTTKLIYRDTFKNWADMKKWVLNDVLLSINVNNIQ